MRGSMAPRYAVSFNVHSPRTQYSFVKLIIPARWIKYKPLRAMTMLSSMRKSWKFSSYTWQVSST